MTLAPRIDAERPINRLDRFATIGATVQGGVDRQALTSVTERRVSSLQVWGGREDFPSVK